MTSTKMTFLPTNVFKNVLEFTDDRMERKQKELMGVIVEDFLLASTHNATWTFPRIDYDIPTRWSWSRRLGCGAGYTYYKHRKLEQWFNEPGGYCCVQLERLIEELDEDPNAFRGEKWREEQRALIDYSETCNPPCDRENYIGRSWWKCIGFHSSCECAHYIDNMQVKYSMNKIPMLGEDWYRQCEIYKCAFPEMERRRKEKILKRRGFRSFLKMKRKSKRIHFNNIKNMFIKSKIIMGKYPHMFKDDLGWWLKYKLYQDYPKFPCSY